MKTKPITLILTLLFCLSGSVFAELDLSVKKFLPITVTHSLRNIQKAVNDGDGSTYVCGNYRGSLIYGETKIGSLASNSGGGGGFGDGTSQDIFLAKFKGKELLWINSINGESRDVVYDLAYDNGDIYITGLTNSRWLYFNGKKMTPKWSATSPFCAKYSSEGKLIWFKQIYQTGGEVRLKVNDNNLNVIGFVTDDFSDPNLLFTSKAFSVLVNKDGNIFDDYKFSIPMKDPLLTFGVDNDFYLSSRLGREPFKFNNKIYSSAKSETLIFKSDRKSIKWIKQIGTPMFPALGNTIANDSKGNTYIYSFFRNNFFLDTKYLKAQTADNAFIAKITNSGSVDWIIQTKGKFARLEGLIHPITDNLLLKGFVNGEFKIKDRTFNLSNDLLLEIDSNSEIVDDYIFPSNAVITGMSIDKNNVFLYSKTLPEVMNLESKEYNNTSFDMGMFELQFNSKNSADEKFNLEGDLFYGVKVKGLIGQRFEIQFTTDVSNGNWKSLGFLTLKEDEEIFIDKDGIGGKRRFYRALLRKR